MHLLILPQKYTWTEHPYTCTSACLHSYCKGADIQLFFQLMTPSFSRFFTKILGLHNIGCSRHSSVSLLTLRRKLTKCLYSCALYTLALCVVFLNWLQWKLNQHHSTKIALTVIKNELHVAKSSSQLSVIIFAPPLKRTWYSWIVCLLNSVTVGFLAASSIFSYTSFSTKCLRLFYFL